MTSTASGELVAWVRASFPGFEWEICDTRSGAFHDVVIDGAAGVVARVLRGTDHHRRAAREAAIIHAACPLPLGVHLSTLLAGPVSGRGRSGYVMTHLPGRPVAMADWGSSRDSYAALLSRFTALTIAGLELPPARTWCGGLNFAALVTTQLVPLLGAHGEPAELAVSALLAMPGPAQPSFVHGDFGPHNLLWEGARPVSLLDLDHACIDDPAIDLAPLIGVYGVDRVAEIVAADLVHRAMIHRATLSLQVAAAAHLAGNHSLRDHALSNFVRRSEGGTLHDPNGSTP